MNCTWHTAAETRLWVRLVLAISITARNKTATQQTYMINNKIKMIMCS